MSFPDSSHPRLRYDVAMSERYSRLMLFLKPFLVIPHLIVLALLSLVAMVVTTIAWFAILITGRYPRGMWDFVLGVLRWNANITAYASSFQTDPYPPFSGSADYPVQFELDYPTSLSRLLIFIKWLLVIPHYVALWVLGIAANIAILISWVAMLFTARYPESLFRFVVGYYRWSYRVSVYTMLLTDDYPPFALEDQVSPPSAPSLGDGNRPPALDGPRS